MKVNQLGVLLLINLVGCVKPWRNAPSFNFNQVLSPKNLSDVFERKSGTHPTDIKAVYNQAVEEQRRREAEQELGQQDNTNKKE